MHLRDMRVELDRAVAALVQGEAFGEVAVLGSLQLDFDFVGVAKGASALDVICRWVVICVGVVILEVGVCI